MYVYMGLSRGYFRNIISQLSSVMDVPFFGEVGTEVLHVAIEFLNVYLLPVLATVLQPFASLSTALHVYRIYQLHIPPSRVVTRFESEIFRFTLEVILR